MSAPITIKGLRLPHLKLALSEIDPIKGCIISPEIGPANQTSAVIELVIPSESK